MNHIAAADDWRLARVPKTVSIILHPNNCWQQLCVNLSLGPGELHIKAAD